MLQAILEGCASGSDASGRHSREEHFLFIAGYYLPMPFHVTLPDTVLKCWLCHLVSPLQAGARLVSQPPAPGFFKIFRLPMIFPMCRISDVVSRFSLIKFLKQKFLRNNAVERG